MIHGQPAGYAKDTQLLWSSRNYHFQ